MNQTLSNLLSSRKFWVGAISLAAVFGAVLLRSMKLIDSEALVPTISAITATGLGYIGSTAYEDAAKNAKPTGDNTTNVTNVNK